MRRMSLYMVCALLWLLAAVGANAQSTNSGDIRGSVTDATGALVPDVQVTVLNVDTGVVKNFTTNRDGLYDTASIVAGSYKIIFSKVGFDKFARGPITLQVGFTTVNAELKVGSTNEEITVTSDVPLLTTETGEQTTTLESKSMSQLPQTTQTWENFMILLPGTTGAPGGNQGAASPGQGASSNGNLPYSNILADGVSTSLSHSQNANTAIFETVSELQVSLSSFSAQYGIGGMIINQITKGGTSQFHGSAYDYAQNNFLNAASFGFASQPKVAFKRYHNFGGSVGGPILKKKMFFFFDYDQILSHGQASGTNDIPTPAVMSGDFTGQLTIYDPTTQTYGTDANGNKYPIRKSFLEEYGKNAIPQSMFDSVAANFQKWYPTTTDHLAGGKFVTGSTGADGNTQKNFYAVVPQSTPYRKFFGRLDYDITANNRLSLSDTQSDTPVVYPNTVTKCPIGCQTGDVDNNNAQITDVWNISSRTINEARMGYTWQGNFFEDDALGKDYPTQLGWKFAKANTFPAIDFGRNYPYAWIAPSTNYVYKEHVLDPSDVVTMILGRNVLHFGGEMLIYRDDSTVYGNTNAGTLTFGGKYTENWTLNSKGVASASTTTGLEYADFLLGYVQSWSANVSPEYGARLKSPQMFIQDDFKVRPNLTVNMGLRYQINHGWNEVHGNMATFDPTVLNTATNTNGATWYGSTHANGRTSLQADVFNNFMPRIGFSWLPIRNTTLRGGFGLYSYNWSLDAYGNGMGSAVSSSGNASDQTSGITPITILSGDGSTLPYTAASTSPTRFNGSAVGFQVYHAAVPKIYQWNLAVQREINTNTVAEVSYVASHGFNLNRPTDLDQVPASGRTSVQDAANRPYTQYTSVSGNMHDAISNYDSLQASITTRMSHGLSYGFNYVWSHFLDEQDSSGWGSHMGAQYYQDAYNPRANYSNSNFDVRHNFKGQVVYALPIGKGKPFLNRNALMDAVIGGWQISGTGHVSTGQPFTVIGTQATWARAGSAFPNWSGLSATPKHRSTHCMAGYSGCANEWYNPAAFTRPADGTFGNVRRNSLYGPGMSQVNLSGSKTFSIPWENSKLQLRADANNAFNHASFGLPTATLAGAANAGDQYTYSGTQQISGTTMSGRTVQIGMRLTY